MPLVVPCYAKVNYTLDVLSRRADGYHSIATVMQTISLADTLEIEEIDGPGVEFLCDAEDVPRDRSNLACRAAEMALAEAGSDRGLRLRLTKRVPAQAGLGGGSSDAAAALRGVDAFLGLELGASTLHRLAAALGSDVPFFLTGGTAACRGRGEEVTPLPDGPTLWLVVVKPQVGVSTAAAYAALDADPARISARATRAMERVLAEQDPDRIVARMINDFESAVFEQRPEIALLHDELIMARASNARLCGSGAAVFGVAGSREEAARIAATMQRKYAGVHVCRTVTRAEALALGETAR